jgi:predicted metal-binding protein
MPKHTLFVCKSCHYSSQERPKDQPTDGTRLLEQVNALGFEQLQSHDFEIQAVGCLWTCDRPRAIAFSAADKPTYLFTNLHDEITAALIEFGELYRHSTTGDIPWKQFPEVLQSASIAKIPVSR